MKVDDAQLPQCICASHDTSTFAIILATISTLRLFRRRFDPIWLKFPSQIYNRVRVVA